MIQNIDLIGHPQGAERNANDIREYLYKAIIQLNYELEELSRRIAALEQKEGK